MRLDPGVSGRLDLAALSAPQLIGFCLFVGLSMLRWGLHSVQTWQHTHGFQLSMVVHWVDRCSGVFKRRSCPVNFAGELL
jgi:hypothetical protein